jgi:hypothetical protein
MSGAVGATAPRNARYGSASPARRTTGGAVAGALRATGPRIMASTLSPVGCAGKGPACKDRDGCCPVGYGASCAPSGARRNSPSLAIERLAPPLSLHVAFVSMTRGLRHRDRIAASNRSWIGCLRRARAATRQGQRVDVSTFSCRLLEIASGHRRSIGRGSAPEPAPGEEG